MKKIIIFLSLIVALSSFNVAYAKREPMPAGTVTRYYSAYKDWELEVINSRTLLASSPAKAIYKHKGVVVWEKALLATPGIVSITYDGRYIVMIYWDNFDEDWYRSMAIFSQDGGMLKEFNLAKKFPVSIRKTVLSKDGHYFVIAKSGSDSALITLIDLWKQEFLWEKKYGLREIDNLQLCDDGAYLLLSTYDLFCHEEKWRGMEKITVCDKPRRLEAVYIKSSGGKVLWAQIFDQGYAWNQKFIQLSSSGLKFSVFNLKKNKWLDFVNENGKVV